METPQNPSLEVLAQQSDWIRRLARGLVAGEDRADDVAQQTLLRALESPPQDGRNVRGWLATVARNVARRMQAVDAQRSERERRAAAGDSLPATSHVVEKVEMLRQVSSAVLAVREPYRTVLLLRYYEDLSPRTIADRMHIPIETVRSQIKRGLAQVRERLDRSRGGDSREWLRGLLVATGLPSTASATATATATVASATTTTMITSASTGNLFGALLIMAKSAKLIVAAILIASGAVVTWQVIDRKPDPPAVAPLAKAETPLRSDVGAEPTREVMAPEPIAEPATLAPTTAAPAASTSLDPSLEAIRDGLDSENFDRRTGWDESVALADLVGALRNGVLDPETCASLLETRIGKAMVVPGTEKTTSSKDGTTVTAMLVYPTGQEKPAAAHSYTKYDADGKLVGSYELINIRESPVAGLDWQNSTVQLAVTSTRLKDGSLKTSLRIQAGGVSSGTNLNATDEERDASTRVLRERQKNIDRMYADGVFGRPFEMVLTREAGESRFTSYQGSDRSTIGSQPVGAATSATFWRLFEHMGDLLPLKGR